MKGGSFHCLGCGKWWLTGLFTPLHRNVAVRGCMYGRETLLCGLPRPWSVNASSQSGEPRYFFFVVSPPWATVESIRRFDDAHSTLKTIVLLHQKPINPVERTSPSFIRRLSAVYLHRCVRLVVLHPFWLVDFLIMLSASTKLQQIREGWRWCSRLTL